MGIGGSIYNGQRAPLLDEKFDGGEWHQVVAGSGYHASRRRRNHVYLTQ
jgi:hypothetical protein